MSLQRGSRALVLLALFALAIALGCHKIREFDYWWHARTGQLIAETGSVPKHDVFTYTVPGNRWVDIHWLFQLGLHGVRELGGHAAVIAAKALGVAALVAALLPIGFRRSHVFMTGTVLGLMLLVAADRFEPRPELPSFAFLAVALALVDRHERRGGRAILWAVPLQLVWVNVHGLFAVGLAVLGLALAAETLRPIMVPGAPLRRERLGPLAAALALSVAVSLVNPNGVDALLYPLEQLQMIGPAAGRGVFGSVIAELLPTIGSERSLAGIWLVLAAILAGGSLVAMAVNWRAVSAFDPLAWAAFGWLALGANRNVALSAIVAAALTLRNAGAWLERRPLGPRGQVAANALVGLVLAALTWDIATQRFFARLDSPREVGFGVTEFFFPVRAADWIAREKPPGPICHHMANGGYLIDRLWPEYRVMTDGRLEVFGPDTFARLQVTGLDRFRELDEEYHFGVVLLQPALFDPAELISWLRFNPNWRLVQLDDTSALFVREGPDAHRWPSLDLDAPDLLPPFDAARSPSDRLRRLSRTHLWTILGRPSRALAVFEEALARYPDLERERSLHAHLLQANGFGAAAEAVLRQALEADPADATALTQLGDLRQAAGDLDQARTLFDQALAIEPNQPQALGRRATLAESVGDLQGAEHYRGRLRALSGDPASLGLAP